jgi:hypothetical protein
MSMKEMKEMATAWEGEEREREGASWKGSQSRGNQWHQLAI